MQYARASKEVEKLNKSATDLRLELQQKQESQTQQTEELKKKQEEIQQQLDQRIKDVEKRVEARNVRLAAQKALPGVSVAKAAPTASYGGTKADWLRASGIPESQWPYVDFIVSHESGWNQNAVNKSSGACGLGQQLPCGKWAGAWNDPVAALKAMTVYVSARYGGWAGAVAFWQAHNWY